MGGHKDSRFFSVPFEFHGLVELVVHSSGSLLFLVGIYCLEALFREERDRGGAVLMFISLVGVFFMLLCVTAREGG